MKLKRLCQEGFFEDSGIFSFTFRLEIDIDTVIAVDGFEIRLYTSTAIKVGGLSLLFIYQGFYTCQVVQDFWTIKNQQYNVPEHNGAKLLENNIIYIYTK